MKRVLTSLFITGFASVTLMQVPCSQAKHGFSIFPSIGGTVGNPFSSLTGILGF